MTCYNTQGEEFFPFQPEVKDAATKLINHYLHKMQNYEQQEVLEIMETGNTTGELTPNQAKRLGWLTYAYPNNFVYIILGWWNGTDNP